MTTTTSKPAHVSVAKIRSRVRPGDIVTIEFQAGGRGIERHTRKITARVDGVNSHTVSCTQISPKTQEPITRAGTIRTATYTLLQLASISPGWQTWRDAQAEDDEWNWNNDPEGVRQ